MVVHVKVHKTNVGGVVVIVVFAAALPRPCRT